MVLNYLYSGTREEISGPAVVRIGREGSSTKEPARIRKTKLAIAPPKSFLKSEDTQQFGTIAMRSLSLQKVLLFGPKNTSVAGGSQEFRWQAFPGADRYRIRIFDSRDHLVFDAYTKESSGQRSTATLSPGESYLWIVNAYRDGHAVAKGVGQFNVLSEAQSSELERQEKAIRSEDADEGEKALHLCMLYDDYGMKERICRLLSDLRKNREDNENIATYLNAYDCGDDRR